MKKWRRRRKNQKQLYKEKKQRRRSEPRNKWKKRKEKKPGDVNQRKWKWKMKKKEEPACSFVGGVLWLGEEGCELGSHLDTKMMMKKIASEQPYSLEKKTWIMISLLTGSSPSPFPFPSCHLSAWLPSCEGRCLRVQKTRSRRMQRRSPAWTSLPQAASPWNPRGWSDRRWLPSRSPLPRPSDVKVRRDLREFRAPFPIQIQSEGGWLVAKIIIIISKEMNFDWMESSRI